MTSEQPEKEIKHGHYSTYSNHNCRCEACRQAHNQWHREYRASSNGRERALLANRRSRRIQQEAASWLKNNHPREYAEIVVMVNANITAP